MWTYLITFAIAAGVSLALTPLVRNLATSHGWVDDPAEERKVHDLPIPRVGGVAIAVAFFAPVLGLIVLDNPISHAFWDDPLRTAGLLVGSMAMVLLGLLDDVSNLSAKTKFAVQVVVAVLAFGLGFQVEHVGFLFGDLALGWWSFPITILWIVGIINAVNLLDGLDGLASGMALLTVITLFAVGAVRGHPVTAMTSIALAGALVGFLRYNFNPASIFMGDSGSLFLGYVLSVTALAEATKSTTLVSVAIPILVLGLPILDTSLAIARRFVGGRPIFAADRQHIHHRLLDMGLTHRQAVLTLYGVSAVFCVAAFANIYATSAQTAIILGGVASVALVFTRLLGYLTWQTVNDSVRYGLLRQQRLRHHLRLLDTAAIDMSAAVNDDDVLSLLRRVALDLDLDELALDATVTSANRESKLHTHWVGARGDLGDQTVESHTVVHPLEWSRDGVAIGGYIRFVWHCDKATLQIPEEPGYRLLALCTRDALLLSESRQGTDTRQPRLVQGESP